MEDYGDTIVKLKELIDKQNITRTSLARNTGLRYEIIADYYSGKIKRIDRKTISKICNYLNCKVEDILEYVPSKK